MTCFLGNGHAHAVSADLKTKNYLLPATCEAWHVARSALHPSLEHLHLWRAAECVVCSERHFAERWGINIGVERLLGEIASTLPFFLKYEQVSNGEHVTGTFFESNEVVCISRTSHQEENARERERERERKMQTRPREIVFELSCSLKHIA